MITYILLAGYPPFVPPNDHDDADAECVRQLNRIRTYRSLDSQSEFFRSAEAALLQMIVRGRYRFHSHSWARISDEAKDFVRSLMCVDPSKRVTCEEALQHPWLRLHLYIFVT